MESVLVVGHGDDTRRRNLFEQDLILRFDTRGVAAVAGSDVLPAFDGLDRDAIRRKARELRIRSVLVGRLLSVDTKRYYVSGQPMRYYGYFDPATGREYSPGTWDDVEVVRTEAELYDAATGELIWSAALEFVDPSSDEKLARSLGKEVIDDLTRRGLLGQ